jgi:hypothetical protein
MHAQLNLRSICLCEKQLKNSTNRYVATFQRQEIADDGKISRRSVFLQAESKSTVLPAAMNRLRGPGNCEKISGEGRIRASAKAGGQ